MKKITYILTTVCLFFLMGTMSCEMRDELKGRIPSAKGETGTVKLELELKDITKANILAVDVSRFTIQILNDQGYVVKEYPSYAAMLEEGTEVVLPVGTYKVRAASYAGDIEEAVLNKPYFLGETEFIVKAKEVAEVKNTCKLDNVVVAVSYGADFVDAVQDDYVTTLTNGNGVLTLNKEANGYAFFKVAPTMNIAVRATTKNGKEIYKSQTLTGNNSDDLQSEDYFNIKIGVQDTIPSLPDPGPGPGPGPDEPSVGEPSFDITIDVTMNGREEDIVIPPPTNPDVKPDPDPNPDPNPGDDNLGVPTISGAGTINIQHEAVYVGDPVVVNVKAPNGLKNLYVQIGSNVNEFIAVIKPMGLQDQFDLVNPGSLKGALSEIGLLDPDAQLEGQTNYDFKVTEFMSLLSQFPQGTHTFQLTVEDGINPSVSATLTVNVVKAN